MSKTVFVGFEKIYDTKNNSQYIIYLKTFFELKGEQRFKKSNLVVDELPEARVGDNVKVDFKKNSIVKVEVK